LFSTESKQEIGANSTVYPIWNTTVGGNSVPSSIGTLSGEYWTDHRPSNVFDGNWTSSFCSYGAVCNYSRFDVHCGENTGVYVTLQDGPIILTGFLVVSGEYGYDRDPTKMTIEGSNQNGIALTLGSSWTLLYNGTTGLNTVQTQNTPGIQQSLDDNELHFDSYRFLISQKRGVQTCVEYSEIELFGY
jgi:hypothetical protein